jgi:hypothetical protein
MSHFFSFEIKRFEFFLAFRRRGLAGFREPGGNIFVFGGDASVDSL